MRSSHDSCPRLRHKEFRRTIRISFSRIGRHFLCFAVRIFKLGKSHGLPFTGSRYCINLLAIVLIEIEVRCSKAPSADAGGLCFETRVQPGGALCGRQDDVTHREAVSRHGVCLYYLRTSTWIFRASINLCVQNHGSSQGTLVKVICVGGGPAGLYSSILLKLRHKDWDVSVFERNAAGWTEGWGIIAVGNNLVRQLRDCDQVSASTILAHSTRWTGQVLRLQGRTTSHRQSYGISISRNRFVEILSARATQVGVECHYQSAVTSLDRFASADLIVASDGAGSVIRDAARDVFGTTIRYGRNKYIWLGTTKVLNSFIFSIEKTDAGWIWLHGYPHAKDMSTCVVECSPETWRNLGFEAMSTESAVRLLEGIFADVLEGRELTSGGSTWHNFRTVTNRTWRQGNVVLAGDAAHTTHFSIGEGTRLAIEDAVALSRNLFLHDRCSPALAAYEKERAQAVRGFQQNAELSASWFENIESYLGLPDRELFLLLRKRRPDGRG
jgi:2-polyprenyl-6-methoxyphenol hydroxylase-like FAD-dependent oxidoreductase